MKAIKIIVTHLTDKELYYFELPTGEWIVNDVEYTNPNWKAEKITSKEKPVIFKIERKTEIVYYKNASSPMQTITAHAYNAENDALLQKGTWCNLDEVHRFDNLEDEFEYKKFKRDWKPVTETLIEKHLVETEIRHAMLDTGSEFIKSLFCIDQNTPGLVEVELARYQKHVVSEWLTSNKVTDYDFPSNSHLEYFKIAKNYVFANSGIRNEYNGHNPIRFMTIDDAKKLLVDEKKKIEGRLYSVLCSLRAIPDVNVKQIIDEIQAVRQYLTETVNSNRTSKNTIAMHCRSELQKVVTRLENLSKQAISDV